MLELSWPPAHLLLVVLNKGRLHHVYPVFALDFLTIVQQEGFVSAHFLLDRLYWDLVDGCTDLKSLHCMEKLLGDV